LIATVVLSERGDAMRKVIMWNMLTLDGFFEGPESWDIDWHEYVWGDELEQFSLQQLKSVGALLFGRVTYEGMAAYWTSATGEIADFMNSIPKVVFSKTMERTDWNNSRLVKTSAEEEVARLKRQPGRDLFIFGSANLTASLTRQGLIDEYRLGLNPLVLGDGNPLFKQSPDRMKLKLLEARPLKSGVVILRYERA
jgi:dihydrofolate reductase